MTQKKLFLTEENYTDKMEKVVRPILKRYGVSGSFAGRDNCTLYYETYQNPQEKGAIVISHGFCEFTAKFEEVIFTFFQQGYSVYIMDHRGHGFSTRLVSDPSKVHIGSFQDYVSDFHLFIQKVVRVNSPDCELILYAHSMGGTIAALYLEQHPEVFSCAVLSSPMLEIEVGKIPFPMVWMITAVKMLLAQETDYVPGHKPFNGIPKFAGSSCISRVRYDEIFEKRCSEVRYQTYGATFGWLWAGFQAVHCIQKNAGRIAVPVLLLQAGNDTVVRNRGQFRLAAKSSLVHLYRYPKAKHEIYNADDTTRRHYYNQIFTFLKQWINMPVQGTGEDNESI